MRWAVGLSYMLHARVDPYTRSQPSPGRVKQAKVVAGFGGPQVSRALKPIRTYLPSRAKYMQACLVVAVRMHQHGRVAKGGAVEQRARYIGKVEL